VTRCPVCDGRLRPDDAWCGQCLADLRPPPVPRPAAPAAPARRDTGGPAPASAGPGPGPAAAAPGTVDPDAAGRLADEWAARLAASERGAGLPALAGVTRARGGRAGLAAGAAVAVLAVLVLLMAVGGALL
jgi:hypothetical protein